MTAKSNAQAYADVNKYLNKKLASGLIGIGDLPEALLNIASWPDRKAQGLITGKEVPAYDLGVGRSAKKLLKERAGIDVDEQWEGGPGKGDLTDAVVRTAGHGAEWLGASAVPYTQPLKYAKATAGLGATSGVLQEAGLPQQYADLGVSAGSLIAPPSYKALATRMKGEKGVAQQLAGAIGEENIPRVLENIDAGMAKPYPEGFEPMTAGVAENPALSALHRGRQGLVGEQGIAQQELANKEALMSAMEGLKPEGANLEHTKKQIQKSMQEKSRRLGESQEKTLPGMQTKLEESLGEFPSHAEAGLESGKKIRAKLKKNVDVLRKERHEATHETYESLKRRDERIKPTQTDSYIKDEFGLSRGSKAQIGKQASKDIKTKKKEYIENETSNDILDNIREKIPEIAPDVEKLILNSKKTPPSAGELVEARFNWNEKLSKTRDENKQRIYRNLIDRLDSDIGKVQPEILEELQDVNKIYGDYSTKIHQIERHPAMGKALAYDRKAKQYKAYQEQVSDQFIKGRYSREAARDLLKQVGDDKSVMGAIEQHVNKAVLDNIINPTTGRVDARKLDNFRKNFAGAFELYPQLSTKLKNTENANLFLTNAEKRYAAYNQNLNRSVASDLLNENVRNVTSRVLASDNPITEIKNLKKTLSEDKTGKAWEGFQGLMTDDFLNKIKLSNGELSYSKFNKFLQDHKPALAEVYSPEQMKVLEKIENGLHAKNVINTLGRETNSSTAPKILNALKEKGPTVLSEVIGSKGFGDLAKIESLLNPKKGLSALAINLVERRRLKNMGDVMDRALTDPSFAKLLLTDPRNKSAIKNAVTDVNEAFKASRFPIATLPKNEQSRENPLNQEEWMYEEEIPTEEDY